MQWDTSPHAGFSDHDPWLPVAADAVHVNVVAEDGDAASILSLYRQLLELRKRHAALSIGGYQAVATTGSLLAYVRHTEAERLVIVANLSNRPAEFSLQWVGGACSVLVSTYSDAGPQLTDSLLSLRADEGVIVALEPPSVDRP